MSFPRGREAGPGGGAGSRGRSPDPAGCDSRTGLPPSGRWCRVPRPPEDIGEFAGRTFDYHAAHPELARLLLWEGLADGPAADEANRTAHYQNKARAYAAAQRAGILDDDLDPDHLVFLIIALAAWWLAVPQLARMLTGSGGNDPVEHARRRESVVRAAQRLALASR